MAYKSLRTYLNDLEAAGELAHVTCEVDWYSEVGAITRAMYKRMGPGILFENVKDSEFPLFVGAMHKGVNYGLMFDIGPGMREQSDFLNDRMGKRIDPVIVEEAACRENIFYDDDVDLTIFPTPQWHKKDGGRFIGTMGVQVTADPDTGIQNVTICRQMLEGKNKLGFNSEQQCRIHANKYWQKGQNCPFAMSLGVPPAVAVAAMSKLPYGVDEYTVAGSLAGEPIPLVKCLTNDLYVPADAEIVVEGYIPYDQNEWLDEGPFGEFTGHFSANKPNKKPTAIVTCVYYRNKPIMQGCCPAVGIEEQGSALLRSNNASYLNALKSMGLSDVVDLSFMQFACSHFVCAISLKKPAFGGVVQQVANAVGSIGPHPKILVLVDDDIDVQDPKMVLWAVASRVQPHRDIRITPPNHFTSPLDPSLPDFEKAKGAGAQTSRMIIDATTYFKNATYHGLVTDDEETLNMLKERWSEYGLPIEW